MSWTVLSTIGGLGLIDAEIGVGVLLGSLALVPIPIWWIHRSNARKINIAGISGKPFHSGHRGLVQVDITNNNKHSIHNASLSILKTKKEYLETTLVLPGDKTSTINITIPEGMLGRGKHKLDRATLHTGFPFHMFTTFHQADFESHIIVYPEVETRAPDWPVSDQDRQKSRMGDDIVGMREYQHGDAMRSIDWKLSAKRSSLVVREYDRPQNKSLMFSWEQVEDLGIEPGLRRLTAWILRAERNGRIYALDMGGVICGPNRGQKHLHTCLTKLATYGQSEKKDRQ